MYKKSVGFLFIALLTRLCGKLFSYGQHVNYDKEENTHKNKFIRTATSHLEKGTIRAQYEYLDQYYPKCGSCGTLSNTQECKRW